MALKMSAPLFSEAWLAETVLDPDDVELPTLFNAEGDEIEFIELHYKFSKGTTQKKLRESLNDAADMEAATSKVWNWIFEDDEKSKRQARQSGHITYKSHLEGGALVVGMIELDGKKLEARVNSVKRATILQDRLKNLLGDMVSEPMKVHQTVEQAVAGHRERGVSSEQPDIPPEIEAQIVNDFYDQHYRETLDQPIAMLDNKSPRQAAKTQDGGAKVIAWLQMLEKGDAKLRQSKTLQPYDFS